MLQHKYVAVLQDKDFTGFFTAVPTELAEMLQVPESAGKLKVESDYFC